MTEVGRDLWVYPGQPTTQQGLPPMRTSIASDTLGLDSSVQTGCEAACVYPYLAQREAPMGCWLVEASYLHDYKYIYLSNIIIRFNKLIEVGTDVWRSSWLMRIVMQDGSVVFTVLLKGLRTAEPWVPCGFKRLDAAQDFVWLCLGLAVCYLSGHAWGSNDGCRTSWRIISECRVVFSCFHFCSEVWGCTFWSIWHWFCHLSVYLGWKTGEHCFEADLNFSL